MITKIHNSEGSGESLHQSWNACFFILTCIINSTNWRVVIPNRKIIALTRALRLSREGQRLNSARAHGSILFTWKIADLVALLCHCHLCSLGDRRNMDEGQLQVTWLCRQSLSWAHSRSILLQHSHECSKENPIMYHHAWHHIPTRQASWSFPSFCS